MRALYTGAIFDLDGTLVDSYEPITDSLNHARGAFGLPAKTLAEVRREVGHGLESLIRDNIGQEKVEDGVRLFRTHYRKVFLEGTRLLPGVAATLAALSLRAVPMAITSNKPAYFSREIVERLGLGGIFRAILGPEMVARPKPDPEMVLKAVELIRRPREQILYVGDMTIDIETCRNAAIDVCVVEGGSDTREILLAAKPDMLANSFEQILSLFIAEPARP